MSNPDKSYGLILIFCSDDSVWVN